jgi:hypothetical protein
VRSNPPACWSPPEEDEAAGIGEFRIVDQLDARKAIGFETERAGGGSVRPPDVTAVVVVDHEVEAAVQVVSEIGAVRAFGEQEHLSSRGGRAAIEPEAQATVDRRPS